jgi:hypothetical protein
MLLAATLAMLLASAALASDCATYCGMYKQCGT